MKLKPFIGRIGGKAKIAKFIVEQFKNLDYSIYCEPFLGSGAIYFELVNAEIPSLINLKNKHFRAILNDADKSIVNLFKTVRDYPYELAYDLYFTPYSREEHKESKKFLKQIETQDIKEVDKNFKIEWARQYLIKNLQSVSTNGGWSFDKYISKNITKENRYQWQENRVNNILNIAENHLSDFKKVYLECDDFEKIMRRWDTLDTLHYCDPPYYEKENYYEFKFNKEDHVRLANTAHEMKGHVVISYYPHQKIFNLYNEKYWNYIYKETSASSKGLTSLNKEKTREKRTELLLVKKTHN